MSFRCLIFFYSLFCLGTNTPPYSAAAPNSAKYQAPSCSHAFHILLWLSAFHIQCQEDFFFFLNNIKMIFLTSKYALCAK